MSYSFRRHYFLCPRCSFFRGMGSRVPCGCGEPTPTRKHSLTDEEYAEGTRVADAIGRSQFRSTTKPTEEAVPQTDEPLDIEKIVARHEKIECRGELLEFYEEVHDDLVAEILRLRLKMTLTAREIGMDRVPRHG